MLEPCRRKQIPWKLGGRRKQQIKARGQLRGGVLVVESATAESTPIETRLDLDLLKVQRLRELSATALAKPDPKQAVLSAAGADSLELCSLIKEAATSA